MVNPEAQHSQLLSSAGKLYSVFHSCFTATVNHQPSNNSVWVNLSFHLKLNEKEEIVWIGVHIFGLHFTIFMTICTTVMNYHHQFFSTNQCPCLNVVIMRNYFLFRFHPNYYKHIHKYREKICLQLIGIMIFFSI